MVRRRDEERYVLYEGEYTLANVPENAEVTISFIGYQTLTFKANDKEMCIRDSTGSH